MPTPEPTRADGGVPWNSAAVQQAIAQLDRTVLGPSGLHVTLQRVAELTKHVVPELAEVSVTLLEDDRAQTVVFTGPLAVQLDERQYEVGYGPCMDAALSGSTIRVSHIAPDPDYPEFSRTAADLGISHSAAVGLPVAGRVIGALNLYSATSDPLDPAAVELIQVFAAHAAIAITNAAAHSPGPHQAERISELMNSRATIEQAKGIIMARERCPADQAFTLLIRATQHPRRKLLEVARTIVAEAR